VGAKRKGNCWLERAEVAQGPGVGEMLIRLIAICKRAVAKVFS